MCVGLYFSVLTLEVMPIIGQWSWLKSRFPRLSAGMQWIHHLAPYLAILGLGLSMLHQSSLGATYGILKARPYWYQPGLAVLFMVSAMAGGPALTVLISKIAARVSTRATVDQGAIDKATRFIGWVLVAFLYMRFWDLLSTNYTYAPGRSEAMALLTRGPLALNFWVGEIGLGIILPIILLLGRPFRQHDRYQVLALFLVAAGVVAYRWDINMAGLLVVTGQTPHVLTPLYAAYTPSLVEIAAGAGVIAYGALAFSLGVRYLDVVRGGTPVVQAESARVQTAPRLSISSSSS
jgi:molybdopterin-containing oxidoreductase family membrane subunit